LLCCCGEITLLVVVVVMMLGVGPQLAQRWLGVGPLVEGGGGGGQGYVGLGQHLAQVPIYRAARSHNRRVNLYFPAMHTGYLILLYFKMHLLNFLFKYKT
jgi:hypothetical protein